MEGKTMSNASKSMLACGTYLIFIGISLLFTPENVLKLLGVSTPPDLMSRMGGMVFLIFSYIYFRTGLKDEGMEFFYLITVQERCTLPIFLTIFYILGYGNWLLVLFGFIDLGFGLWTYIALRIDRSKKK
jgi:hypothetical protein